MRFSLLQATLLLASPITAEAGKIEGTWRFVRVIYQSKSRFPKDPNLKIYLNFNSNLTSSVYWTYDYGLSFCESRGQYQWNGHLLKNEIIWVHPLNKPECAEAEAMHVGYKTETPAWIFNDSLNLDFGEGSNSLIYVWKNISN